MKYIVVDLEMNPISKVFKEQKAICTNEIIEIGAVMLNENFKEIDSFKSYVRPRYCKTLQSNIVDLTGITDEMVMDAPDFSEAIRCFFEWCTQHNDVKQIVQWSENDYSQLISEIRLKNYKMSYQEQYLMSIWHDLQQEYDSTIGMERQVSLHNAVMFAGEDFEGKQHDALCDARNTAGLLKKVRIPEEKQKSLGSVIDALKSKPIASSLGDLFDFAKLCSFG